MVDKFLFYIRRNKRYIVFIHIIYFLFLFQIFYTKNIVIDSVFEMSIKPKDFFLDLFFLWKNDRFLGYSNAWALTYVFPVAAFYYILNYISSIINPHVIFFCTLLFLSYYFFYIFIKNEINKGKDSILLIIPSVFYSINIFVALNLSGATTLILPYIFIPLQLNLLNKIILKQNYKDIFLFAITFLLSTAINPPTLAINLIILFIYFIYKIINYKNIKYLDIIRSIILIIIITIGINFYWIISLISFFTESADYNSILSEPLSMQNQSSTYLNVLRLIGLWSFGGGHNGIPYYNYSAYYLNNQILLLLNFLTLILVFGFSFLNKHKSDIKVISLIYLSISVPMIVATNQGVFSKGYEFLYNNMPLFSMFRSSYKFMAMFIFSIAILMAYFLIKVKNKYFKYLGIFVFIAFIIYGSYPIWGNKVFLDGKEINNIPEYYFEASSYFNNNKSEFKVLLLPVQYFAVFEWGKIDANPEILFDKSLVVRQAGSPEEKSNKITLQLYEYLLSKNYEAFEKLSADLGIKYIVQRNDFDWEFYKEISQSPEVINDVLAPYEKVAQFDELDIYLIDGYKPNIYSNNTKFQRINPTKYKINTFNIKDNQDISFLESFDNQWKLYLNPINSNNKDCNVIQEYNNDGKNIKECEHTQKFFEGEELSYLWKKPIFEDTHQLVYDYANQWTIDPEYIKANFDSSYYKENPDGSIDIELTLYFKPQSYFYLGIIISGTTLILCLGYLGYDFWKNKKNKSDKDKTNLIITEPKKIEKISTKKSEVKNKKVKKV